MASLGKVNLKVLLCEVKLVFFLNRNSKAVDAPKSVESSFP